MSQDNVEIVREAWGAWLRGDLDTLFANYVDRDAIYDLTRFREWPDNTYQGIDGVRRGLTEWLAVWEAWEAGVERFSRSLTPRRCPHLAARQGQAEWASDGDGMGADHHRW